MSFKIAELMRWHHNGRLGDDSLRHPAGKYETFSLDPRNVRLELTSDWFNHFGTMNITHSMWHIMLVHFNFSHWMCMKESLFMLSLLIPSLKGPRNNIDT